MQLHQIALAKSAHFYMCSCNNLSIFMQVGILQQQPSNECIKNEAVAYFVNILKDYQYIYTARHSKSSTVFEQIFIR